jgi:hypothetical protein
MSSAAAQARAQQLNAKMESEARIVLDSIDKLWLRKVAKASSLCVVSCFDKAGTTGPTEVLEQCSRSCQVKYQNANAIAQNVSLLSFDIGFHMDVQMKDSDLCRVRFITRKQLNSRIV